MKSTLSLLTPNDREALVHLYDTNDYKVLSKLITLERTELAKDAIEQKDIAEVRYLAGQSDGLKRLLGTIRSNFQDETKKS